MTLDKLKTTIFETVTQEGGRPFMHLFIADNIITECLRLLQLEYYF